MISPAYVQRMARYNQWQNENQYGAADRLPELERTRQTGAFWRSIHGTLSHLMWGDQIWMRRSAVAARASRRIRRGKCGGLPRLGRAEA